MRISIAVLLFAAVAAIPHLAAFGGPITVPTGLHSGDQYRLAFVTSATRGATSSNIADYNAFVTTDANSVPALAALGTTWTAIASTASANADDNTNTNPSMDPVGVPIYTLGNTLIASTNTALWSGSITNPISFEDNGSLATVVVWTGTGKNGSAYSPYPLGATPYVEFGDPTQARQEWIQYDPNPPTVLQPLYAMSGVLTG
jgi:hypothetical protein